MKAKTATKAQGAPGNPAPTMSRQQLLTLLTKWEAAIELIDSIACKENPAGLPRDILEGELWAIGAPMTDAFREITRNYLHATG